MSVASNPFLATYGSHHPRYHIAVHIFKDMTVNGAMLATFFSGVVFYESLYVVCWLGFRRLGRAEGATGTAGG